MGVLSHLCGYFCGSCTWHLPDPFNLHPHLAYLSILYSDPPNTPAPAWGLSHSARFHGTNAPVLRNHFPIEHFIQTNARAYRLQIICSRNQLQNAKNGEPANSPINRILFILSTRRHDHPCDPLIFLRLLFPETLSAEQDRCTPLQYPLIDSGVRQIRRISQLLKR